MRVIIFIKAKKNEMANGCDYDPCTPSTRLSPLSVLV